MDTRLQVSYTVLETLIAMACCLGNLLVIWAVCACEVMRQQPTFCFIVSLATADFLVGAVAIPLAVLADGWIETTFYVCVLRSCVEIVVTQASIHSLLAIALDRFLRVYIPLRYKTMVTQLRSCAIVGVCWLSAVVLGFIPMFGWYRHDTLEHMQHSNSTTITCTFLKVIPMTYMVYFNFLTCLLPPMIIISTLYLCIFLRMHQQLRVGVMGSEFRSYYLKERKLTRSLVVVIALFCVSWLPLRFMNTAELYGAHIPHQGFYIGIVLAHANSALHPLVYSFRIQPIRAACWRILRRYVPCLGSRVADQNSNIEDSNATPSTRPPCSSTA